MTPETAILHDLTSGQSTADSIAQRVRLHPDAVLVILRRELAAGRILSSPLGPLTVWRLAPATIQAPASKP